MTFAVISIHDVAPSTRAECEQLVDAAERIDARTSLLVVPGPWRYPATTEDPEFGPWLAGLERRGHEVVAHGWEHRAVPDADGTVGFVRRSADRLLTRGCAEFGALGPTEAARRIDLALCTLHGLGFAPSGFVAPGWSMSPAAAAAVRTAGVAYTTTRSAIVDHVADRSIPVPAVCHRPGSPLTATGARLLVAIVDRRAAQRRPIRLALHPADVHDGRLTAATARAIATIGRSGLDATTYADAVARCRSPRRPPDDEIGAVR
jgi:predicted deacetylase